MKAKVNYKGRHFGQLTVLDCVEPSNGKNKGGMWLCKCKCRRTVSFNGYQLHHRISCGCLVRKAAIERGKGNQKTEREKLYTLKYRQYKKENPDALSKEEWKKIYEKEECHYCGWSEIDNIIITNQGENVCCCNRCKEMRKIIFKQGYSDIEFLEQVERIYLFQNKPNNNSTKNSSTDIS